VCAKAAGGCDRDNRPDAGYPIGCLADASVDVGDPPGDV